MNDLTLLYYTANTINEDCARRVREHLVGVNEGRHPIISVSQKPLAFGTNICVGEIGMSHYNCYKQILIGTQAIGTKYVACCEDDTLYTAEHFAYRPSSEGVISYNTNMWYADYTTYWQKAGANDTGMCMCIAPAQLLIDTLAVRFERYPESPPIDDKHAQTRWQEPGRFDWRFGIPNANVEYFKTLVPLLVFNYRGSLGGKRGTWDWPRASVKSFKEWGNAKDLWRRYWKTPYSEFT